ncbi:prealbumin-like fold domain-containing protein [Carnobacteriaceae bacterium zg-84]|uniref:MSCRAMM family protein n=1 Tax=Granulicatella sp. zg-84 TaxID=2678503 RepID=UPI0013BF9C7D|nr:prealbumin-like fold domain-containing protein [Granulicatella sp. zg-84]NEW66295.1 hypothetical protein [Granulicatella sp. zg-84]QMI85618.1 prealbumin-like fold domain-containing protein [Carnobacteriaceae bacterium zg-84]
MTFSKLVKRICVLIAFVCLPFSNHAHANDTVTIEIISPNAFANNQDIQYHLFKIGADQSEVDWVKTQDLHTLKNKYTASVVSLNDQSYKVQLERGLYYVLAVSEKTELAITEIVPFFIDLTGNDFENKTIHAKQFHPTGELHLFKYEQQGKERTPLANVAFSLYTKNNEIVHVKNGLATLDADGETVLNTDEMGNIRIFGLAEGEYIIKEVKALPGYQLLTDTPMIMIKANDVTNIAIENHPTHFGGKRFKKVNEQTPAKALQGAVFEVLDADKKPLLRGGHTYTLTSGENGYFEVQDLPYGKYYLREVKAPIVDNVEYAVLGVDIAFEITPISYTDDTLTIIVNRPLPPDLIGRWLPHTGELLSNGYVWGIVFVIVGIFLKKKSVKHDNEENQN